MSATSERKLYENLLSGKISAEEFSRISRETFLQNFSSEELRDTRYGQVILNRAFVEKNAENVELGFELMLIQADLHGVAIDTKILCQLLSETWHFMHEDIAGTLQYIKDPTTVDCLFNAAELHFEYLDYDDTHQFARKCIKALSAIDNDEAINKLKLLAKSKTPEIKQYATKELKYKGLV